MKPTNPPATAIATAARLVTLTEQRAAQAKKTLKLAKARYKSARKALKKARKASRKAAKLARKARRRLDKLESQIAKAGKTAPARKPRAKVKTRPPLKPAKLPKPATGGPQPAIQSPAG
jgi:multidrug efflux pump subunit AcrA (membrane-fusion protein)